MAFPPVSLSLELSIGKWGEVGRVNSPHFLSSGLKLMLPRNVQSSAKAAD